MTRRLLSVFALRFLLLLVLLAIRITPASAHFIDGFLAECTATTATTCTEPTAAGYARQPVYFNTPVRGVTSLGAPYYFGAASIGTIAGRAIYDSPTGGNLLLVLPLATPLVVTAPGDQGYEGYLRITFTALVNYLYGDTYLGNAAAGSTLGLTGDGSTVTNGYKLTFLRGILFPGTLTPS